MCFYNHLLVCKRLMQNISKVIDLQKGKIRILEKISLFISLLLMRLIQSNNLPSTRPIKRIKIIKEGFGIMVNEDKIETKTFLQ